MFDLVEFSARCLRIGGRLVYCLPVMYDFTEEDLPQHPQLRLITSCEQPLTSKYGRRFITMEKVEEQSYESAAAVIVGPHRSYNVRKTVFNN